MSIGFSRARSARERRHVRAQDLLHGRLFCRLDPAARRKPRILRVLGQICGTETAVGCDAMQELGEAAPINDHRAVRRARRSQQSEQCLVQPLAQQGVAVAISPQHLESVMPLVREGEQRPAARVLAEHLLTEGEQRPRPLTR